MRLKQKRDDLGRKDCPFHIEGSMVSNGRHGLLLGMEEVRSLTHHFLGGHEDCE